EFKVGAACAAALLDRAEAIRAAAAHAPARYVTQRALEVQGGRVLRLVETILRAFRAACRADASIHAPKLHRIAWLFEPHQARRAPAPEPAEDAIAECRSDDD